MSDNSFEKKVRQELQGFGVTPSDKVWAHLEAGLKERKRRRGGIIWFFLGTLLLGGGVWLAVKQSPQPAENIIADKNAEVVLKNTPDLNNSSADHQDISVKEIEQLRDQKVDHPSVTSSSLRSNKSRNRNVSYPLVKSKSNVSEEILPQSDAKFLITQNPTTSLSNDPIILKESRVQESNNEIIHNPAQEMKTQVPAVADEGLPVAGHEQISPQDSSTEVTEENKISRTSGKKQSVEARKKKLDKPKKWELNLTASGGMSEVTSGFLEEGTKSNDMFNTGNFGPTMPISYTHSQEKSFGFSGGAEVRRWFNKSVGVSAGVQYQFQRTNSLVGIMSSTNLNVNNGSRDLMVNSFYLPGALTEYRNRYHLVDLPVQLQLAWGHRKLPFVAGIGVQPGILIGSNALIKDRSGILFTDKENFNRFQFGFNGGISVKLMKNSKMPLEAGPHLQYRMTNVFKEETGYKGHLFYFGLQAKWRLLSF